jgi:hypothetical protein
MVILSAISDLQLSKKENISLRNLAFLCMKREILTALIYIQRSLEDALFCNARLRTYEISKMLPIINGAYQQQMRRIKNSYWCFFVVSLLQLFIASYVPTFKQMKQLKTTEGIKPSEPAISRS